MKLRRLYQTAGIALISLYTGCQTPQKGSFEEVQKVLGNRWTKLSIEEKQDLRSIMEKPEDRKIFLRCYTDPQEFYNNLSPREKEQFNSDKYSANPEKPEYSRRLPWGNNTLSDRLFFYILDQTYSTISRR
jgi:hypothetical protein